MTNNKDYLSQEEIDALLKQSSDDSPDSDMEPSTVGESNDDVKVDDVISAMEQDALGEIGNITFGSAATALSTLLGKKVEITTPVVAAIAKAQLEGEFPKPHVAVHVKYVDGFQGINSLVIKTHDAQVIADLMLGGEGIITDEEFNDIHISAVQEAMNQMMGSSATSMSTIFNRFVNISPPGIDILNLASGEGTSNLPDEDIFIKISFRLIIEELIDSTIMQLLPVKFAKDMVASLMGGSEETVEAEEESPVQVTDDELAEILANTQVDEQAASQPAQSIPPQQPQQPANIPPPAPMQQQPMPQVNMDGISYGNLQNQRNVNVQPVQYTNFNTDSSAQSDDVNLNMLLDIPLKVTVELGRTKRLIKDILEFTHGSIIELDKLAGEPVDILVNNKLIAKGEVVVIDENFGVRVTDIVSQLDRINKLQ